MDQTGSSFDARTPLLCETHQLPLGSPLPLYSIGCCTSKYQMTSESVKQLTKNVCTAHRTVSHAGLQGLLERLQINFYD